MITSDIKQHAPASSRSTLIFSPRPAAKLRLFCFPYAGGGASSYRTWVRHLPVEVEMVAIQPPGRESRFGERPPETFELLAEEIADSLHPLLDKPFLFFGHSMGGMMCFEVARLLLGRAPDIKLQRLMISGVAPPSRRKDKPPIHALPDDEFVEELRKLNGTPEEVLANAEMRGLFLPTIRADFRLFENYKHVSGAPLPRPFSVYGGESDDISRDDLAEWKACCASSFDLRMLPGDHFFIHSSEDILMRWLRQDVQRALS